MEEMIEQLVKEGIATLNLPQEDVEHIVSQMITYVDMNVQQGEISAETFFNWLQEQGDNVLNNPTLKGNDES